MTETSGPAFQGDHGALSILMMDSGAKQMKEVNIICDRIIVALNLGANGLKCVNH